MYDAAVQIDVPRPASTAEEDLLAPARGCLLALGTALVIWAIGITVVRWLAHRLFGGW